MTTTTGQFDVSSLDTLSQQFRDHLFNDIFQDNPELTIEKFNEYSKSISLEVEVNRFGAWLDYTSGDYQEGMNKELFDQLRGDPPVSKIEMDFNDFVSLAGATGVDTLEIGDSNNSLLNALDKQGTEIAFANDLDDYDFDNKDVLEQQEHDILQSKEQDILEDNVIDFEALEREVYEAHGLSYPQADQQEQPSVS